VQVSSATKIVQVSSATDKRKSGTQVRRKLVHLENERKQSLFWERFPNRDANLEAIHKNILSEE
jgi:hypothetical protein